MATHWTEYPERVEKFGDLFSIFETLVRDLRADAIHSGSCENESDESAYTVEFLRRGDELVPRPERIPGWDELATYTEREFHRPPSLEVLRVIRGRASEVLDSPIAAVNELTIAQVVEALDADRKRPEIGTDFLLDNYRWLKVTEVAKLLAMNAGQVSKNADAGTFATNGKSGHDRRIDVLSAVRWVLDRLARQNSTGDTV
jgi:hypothetical protein